MAGFLQFMSLAAPQDLLQNFYPAHPLESMIAVMLATKSALAIMNSSEVELESQLDLAWSH